MIPLRRLCRVVQYSSSIWQERKKLFRPFTFMKLFFISKLHNLIWLLAKENVRLIIYNKNKQFFNEIATHWVIPLHLHCRLARDLIRDWTTCSNQESRQGDDVRGLRQPYRLSLAVPEVNFLPGAEEEVRWLRLALEGNPPGFRNWRPTPCRRSRVEYDRIFEFEACLLKVILWYFKK